MTAELVPLLAAYDTAVRAGDAHNRRELAAAICQGVSPDPELFLLRIDLLAAYSMVEHVFVATDVDGHAEYAPLGRRHVQMVEEYQRLIGRLAQPLLEDCSQLTPVAGTCSPYGAIYGFSSDLLGHMTFKVAQGEAVPQFGMEDVFSDGGADKLAWVSRWRKLPQMLTPRHGHGVVASGRRVFAVSGGTEFGPNFSGLLESITLSRRQLRLPKP